MSQLFAPPLALASVMLLCAGVADAHHSYAAFDRAREIRLMGTVRTWEMGNPHGYLWVNVKTSTTGSSELWGFEAPSPQVLINHGWSKYSVKPGDAVTLLANPLKDGRHGGSLLELRLPDGRDLDTRPHGQEKKADAGT